METKEQRYLILEIMLSPRQSESDQEADIVSSQALTTSLAIQLAQEVAKYESSGRENLQNLFKSQYFAELQAFDKAFNAAVQDAMKMQLEDV